MDVDHTFDRNKFSGMNRSQSKGKYVRRDMCDAAREATALKARFRREDEELYRQGRGAEVVAELRRNLGLGKFDKLELLTINGVRIKR